MTLQIILLLVGFVLLIKSADWLVDGASALAKKHNVSDLAIGLTIVAFGTSAPELVVNIFAALQSHDDIVFGNIIGSNIFNIFLILGLSAVLNPVEYNRGFDTDMILLAAGTVLLFLTMFTGKKKKLDRWEAALLLTIYVAYTVFLIIKEV